VQGPIPEGQLVSVQVNYDPGWRAEQDGKTILGPRMNAKENFLIFVHSVRQDKPGLSSEMKGAHRVNYQFDT
jgi:hypothetical protein